MRLSILLAALLSIVSFWSAEAADPLSFERGSWAKLRASHAGQPTVIHFWGLTCGPCLVELPHWGKLRRPSRGPWTPNSAGNISCRTGGS